MYIKASLSCANKLALIQILSTHPSQAAATAPPHKARTNVASSKHLVRGFLLGWEEERGGGFVRWDGRRPWRPQRAELMMARERGDNVAAAAAAAEANDH